MKQLFISDLHLDENHDSLRQAFFSFLNTFCQSADELYILGDFFEVWLGDDHATDFNKSIIKALSNQPADVYLMHGNRDFLLGNAFCKAADATLMDDPTTIETAVGPALPMHGDSLCTMDEAYVNARQHLRSNRFQKEFLSKSLPDRDALAKKLRGESKAHTRETAMDIMDVTPEEVISEMQKASVDILIHGHTHRPAVHDVPLGAHHGTRYVLGDWQNSMQYLEISEAGAMLNLYTF